MKRRKHLLLFILLLLCLIWVLLITLQSFPKWMGVSDSELQKRIVLSNSSFVYVLKPAHWLEFKLPSGTDNVRLVSNASISAWLSTEATDSWQYALDYELLDKNGQLLRENIYHKRTGLNKIKDGVTGEHFAPIFYLSDELAPLDGQSILLNLSDMPNADRLRIKLADTDPAIMDVALRAYYHENIPGRKLDLMWKRMSDKSKEALASGNIYSFDLLTDQERSSLLLKSQRPLSPMGIEGYAYESRILYSMQAFEGEKVFDPIILHGVLIDEHLRGVIPIPENGGSVRIQFDQAYGEGLIGTQEPISIRWFGRKIFERSYHSVVWRGASTHFEQNFDGGFLEISANNPIVARVFLDGADTQLEITPETVYIRGYIADEDESVTYQVAHSNKESTPFRVDFRNVMSSILKNESGISPIIEYDLMDAQDEIIKQGSIQLFSEASSYDRIAGETNDIILSDPDTRYFSLPTYVKQVKFRSDSPVFVFAYNRPARLIHEIKVPEHTYISALDEWNQPAWFPIRPVGYEDLILRSQSVLLTIQPRPPEDKPDLLAGRYQWEDYHPQGEWFARHIFTPLDEVESIRQEAFVSVYRPITLGKSELFDFQAPPGVTNIMPNLAYFRHEDSPVDISILIDGKQYFHRIVDGLQGEIQLPTLIAGQHNLKVTTSSPADIFISHAKPVPGGLLKRLVNRFEKNNMRFVYDRVNLEEDSLSVRLYAPYGKEKRSSVSVQIEAIDPLPLTPMKSWSLDARRFDVRPGITPVSVMGTEDENVDFGYPFFITLGEDLPKGRYYINFFLEEDKDSYLSLSKVTPGVFQEREIFYETEASHVNVTE